MLYTTYADVLRPSAKKSALLYDAALVIGGSLFIALGAQVAVQLPFSPVPITGQTLAVLLVGMLLGSRRGSLSLLAYLAEGLAGLPVFAGGTVGLARLLGPTGGYLVGFIVAAYVTGRLAERGWDRRVGTTILAMLLGNAAIYALGLPWLAAFVGGERALPLGLYPFIPGDLLKLALAAILLPAGWKIPGLNKIGQRG
jgi:biotin transport system substrate-specific component